MAKNLYQVVDTRTQKVIQDGFDKKEDAKVVRNEHNKECDDKAKDGAKPRYVIARGTDHFHGATDGFDHTSRKKFR